MEKNRKGGWCPRTKVSLYCHEGFCEECVIGKAWIKNHTSALNSETGERVYMIPEGEVK